ncbi:ion channel [Halobacillus mangrovi]|uniref:ion channel n=1 Tax=Halobacillus mangrovi TaxID=402384 RepID=UPI003D97FB74
MFTIFITSLCLIVIAASLRQIFNSLEHEHKIFSFQVFLSILLLYMIIMTGFGMIYLCFITQGIPVYMDSSHTQPLPWLEEMGRSMYFSGMTLFTVGYGDMIPIGAGRWIVILEAMVGYSLPAALVIKVWQNVHHG